MDISCESGNIIFNVCVCTLCDKKLWKINNKLKEPLFTFHVFLLCSIMYKTYTNRTPIDCDINTCNCRYLLWVLVASNPCFVRLLTAASMKFRVFWDVAPCSHRRFRGAYCLHHQGDVYSPAWKNIRIYSSRRSKSYTTCCPFAHGLLIALMMGAVRLWNVGQLQRDYTALHPRRL
jgi:hypothetical protein